MSGGFLSRYHTTSGIIHRCERLSDSKDSPGYHPFMEPGPGLPGQSIKKPFDMHDYHNVPTLQTDRHQLQNPGPNT